jgi:NAD(P)H-nitrite reductase large subunit
VILGNGAAGYYAAKEIRNRDKTGTVVLISNEEHLTYNRPMLTKSIVAGLDAEQIAVVDKAWYEENHIYPMLGKMVADVDTEQKEVVLDDGSRIHYTKLIYALGSECFIPPIQGSDLPEVVAIRRLTDTEKVEKLMKQSRQAVVIGGGVLGLEAAWELKKIGLEVTVLEAAPMLMGRQLDEGSGAFLKQIAKKNGIEIRTGANITSIDGTDHVNGVTLSDGETFPAQMVIISAGVRANTKVAQKIGLHINRAIVVNSRMETSLPDIYACGDCAEFQGVNYAVWPQAMEEGKVAGANAAGEALEYVQDAPALTFHGMNTALFAAGDNGKNPNLLYKTMEFQDMGKGQYRKLYFLNNRLCGVILLGDLSDMARMTELLKKHASYEEVMKK